MTAKQNKAGNIPTHDEHTVQYQQYLRQGHLHYPGIPVLNKMIGTKVRMKVPLIVLNKTNQK
jgi:hypothetical protein